MVLTINLITPKVFKF